MSTRPTRNTSTRDKHRAYIRRSKPPCGICHEEIDYTLHYRDPRAFVVDHVIPVALGGPDELDNKQAAHRHCNEAKADKHPADLAPAGAPRLYVTSRTW